MIKKIALFFVGLLLIFAILSYAYDVRIFRKEHFFTLLENFENPRQQPELIFLGDSHPAMAIRNKYLPEHFYNFAFISDDWRLMYLKAILAVEIKPDLQYIAVQMDDHMFTRYRDQDKDFSFALAYADPQQVQAVYSCSSLDILLNKAALRAPLIMLNNRRKLTEVFFDDLKAALKGEENERDIFLDENLDLTFANPVPWPARSESERNAVAQHRTKRQLGESHVTDLADIFHAFLNLCRSRNIKVIGIRYPLTLVYQCAAKQYDTAEAEKEYQKCSFYAVLDYEHLFDSHQEYFNDSDHLNKSGGEAFSEILVHDLQQAIH